MGSIAPFAANERNPCERTLAGKVKKRDWGTKGGGVAGEIEEAAAAKQQQQQQSSSSSSSTKLVLCTYYYGVRSTILYPVVNADILLVSGKRSTGQKCEKEIKSINWTHEGSRGAGHSSLLS